MKQGANYMRHRLHYTELQGCALLLTYRFEQQASVDVGIQGASFRIVAVNSTRDRRAGWFRPGEVADAGHDFTKKWIMDLSAALIAFLGCLKKNPISHVKMKKKKTRSVSDD